MYEYLASIDEGNSYAVVNTEGKICVLASENAVREEVMLRHYAFLLDYMSVPVNKILFTSLDDSVIKNLTIRFYKLYKDLPCEIVPITKVNNIQDYDYVLVRDAHNVDIFTVDRLKALCAKSKNLYMFVNCKTIRKHHNIDLAETLQNTPFDFEISTDGNYSVASYLKDVEELLEKRRRERELEEQRARERAHLEAERKAREEAERKRREEEERIAREKAEAERKAREEAERKAAAERARLEAERRAREEAERKRREEEARRKAEEEARRRAEEELRRKQANAPYFKLLKPYMDWYQRHWDFMVEHGSYKWDAVWHFQKHFNVNDSNLKKNLEISFAKCDLLLTGVLLRSQKTLEKCAGPCPNETKLLLKNLFNEKDTFSMRMMLYRSMSSQIENLMRNRSSVNKEEIAHLNNVRAASTFLALAHPDKHYIYRLFPFQQFCSKVKIKAPSVSEFEAEYEAFETICNQVRAALIVNPDIIKLHNETYKADLSDYHLLTFDFIYAIGQYLIALNLPPKQ